MPKVKEIDTSHMDSVAYISPLGVITIYADQFGVAKIAFERTYRPPLNGSIYCPVYSENSDRDEGECSNSQTKDVVDKLYCSTENPHLRTTIRWFYQYFTDPSKLRPKHEPKLRFEYYSNKAFLIKCWEVLRRCSKLGEQISYKKLADMTGNSNSVLGAGLAMRKNPFPILVPCHRVVNANAKLGSYCWLDGVKTKKWLLDHEKKFKTEGDPLIEDCLRELAEQKRLLQEREKKSASTDTSSDTSCSKMTSCSKSSSSS